MKFHLVFESRILTCTSLCTTSQIQGFHGNVFLKNIVKTVGLPLPSNKIKNKVQSLKVNMVTMETTFHKANWLQCINAMILAEVVLLNVYCVYKCNFLECRYKNYISWYKVIYMYRHILSTNQLNAETRAPPPPLRWIPREEGRQNLQYFVQS